MERVKQVEGENEGLLMRIPQYALLEQSVPLHDCLA